MQSPVIVAFIASALAIVLFKLAGRISHKLGRGAAQIGAFLLAIAVAGLLSADSAVSVKAGEYFFYIIVVYAIGAKVLGRKKVAEA